MRQPQALIDVIAQIQEERAVYEPVSSPTCPPLAACAAQGSEQPASEDGGAAADGPTYADFALRHYDPTPGRWPARDIPKELADQYRYPGDQ